MTKLDTAAVVTGALAAFLMPAAQAQHRLNCAPRATVTAALTAKHGEHPVLRGVAGDVLLEIWLADSGSFSIILTQASGLACMVAAGHSMHHVNEPKPGKKS